MPPNEAALSVVRASFLPKPLGPTLGVPNAHSNGRRDQGCDQRLGPLRGKVRWMRKDVAYKGRKRADRCLSNSRIQFPVHLREQRHTDRRPYDATYGRKPRVLQGESIRKVATRHDQKASKPGARELLNCRARKPAGRQSVLQDATKADALHWFTAVVAIRVCDNSLFYTKQFPITCNQVGVRNVQTGEIDRFPRYNVSLLSECSGGPCRL